MHRTIALTATLAALAPLVACRVLKIGCDMALFAAFRRHEREAA